MRAWEPVHESFRNVLGDAVFYRVYPDWRTSQAAAVRDACVGGTGRVWVAVLDDRPIGFVSVLINVESSAGEIGMIAVDPEHQRRGIGVLLTSLALDQMKEAGCTLAEVATGGDPGHDPARRTYDRAGFTPLPLVRYYKNL